MSRLDPLIELLLREPGAVLLLESGAPASLRTGAGSRPVIRQPLRTEHILGACSEIAPAELRDKLSAGVHEFRYFASGGQVLVRCEQEGDRLRATLRADLPALPPPSLLAPVARRTIAARSPSADPATAMNELFALVIAHGASDLHLQSDGIPWLRVDGEIVRIDGTGALPRQEVEEMLFAIAPPAQRETWAVEHSAEFALEASGARFRVNLLTDRFGIGAAIRLIPAALATAEELQLPPEVLALCERPQGLLLVCGPSGSGKSATLAALTDHVNRSVDGHIVTVEAPIEQVHRNQRCLVNQREVGELARSFPAALEAALREDPDVLVIGELRDEATIALALQAATGGQLVIAAMRASTAADALDQLVSAFSADKQPQARTLLARSLLGVLAQALCRRVDQGRVAAREVLIATGAVANAIREGKTFVISSIIEGGHAAGMVTLNDALVRLVQSGEVTPSDALARSQSRSELQAALARLENLPELLPAIG